MPAFWQPSESYRFEMLQVPAELQAVWVLLPDTLQVPLFAQVL